MTARQAHLLQRVATLAAALGLALGATPGARAAGFQFSPVRVNLNAHDRAASVLLTNGDDAPVRLEVQAFTWTQRADGRSVLVASNSLLVFPELLTIPPHEQRRLRVATTDPPGAVESAYKVTIAEIGAFAPKKTRGADVTITLQVDVPVYVAPMVGRRSGAIAGANVAKRALTFAVVNNGTVHFDVTGARVTGLGANERQLFMVEPDGGDVLAGDKREYRVELPAKSCTSLRALTIKLAASDQQLVQALDVPPGACNP
jgi:P pilus assembly chaperone PapD